MQAPTMANRSQTTPASLNTGSRLGGRVQLKSRPSTSVLRAARVHRVNAARSGSVIRCEKVGVVFFCSGVTSRCMLSLDMTYIQQWTCDFACLHRSLRTYINLYMYRICVHGQSRSPGVILPFVDVRDLQVDGVSRRKYVLTEIKGFFVISMFPTKSFVSAGGGDRPRDHKLGRGGDGGWQAHNRDERRGCSHNTFRCGLHQDWGSASRTGMHDRPPLPLQVRREQASRTFRQMQLGLSLVLQRVRLSAARTENLPQYKLVTTSVEACTISCC
jgi:hypothetical protein